MVGVLLDLTGPEADSEKVIQAGIDVALADINQYLADQQATVRLKLVYAHGAPENAVMLAKLQSLDAQGVKLVIGPSSSENLAHLKDYANQHGMVLISPSSTAPSLALEDNVIRTAPIDILQAHAIARLMQDQGIESVVSLFRNDTWGTELNRELGLAASVFSIRLTASQSYPAASANYPGVIASLSVAVSQAIAQVGTHSVAVELLSFDEAKDIFLAAKDDPLLRAVRWFGCDGNALSPVITADASASAFAVQTRFLASTFLNPFDAGNPQATRSPYLQPFDAIKARISAKLAGVPTEYAYTAYDSLWLAGLACQQLDGFPEASRVRTAILHAAYEFHGASGFMNFDPEFDRTHGDYGFFGIQGNTWLRRVIYHDPVDFADYLSEDFPILTFEGDNP